MQNIQKSMLTEIIVELNGLERFVLTFYFFLLMALIILSSWSTYLLAVNNVEGGGPIGFVFGGILRLLI